MSDNNQQIPPPEISERQRVRQSSFKAQRKRGGCLTSILVILTLFAVNSMISDSKIFIHPVSTFERSISPFISIISIIIAAADLIALYGIWKWKKWGVKLLATSYILGLLISVINEITLHAYNSFFQSRFFITGIISVTGGLAVVLLLLLFFYLEVKKRWRDFS